MKKVRNKIKNNHAVSTVVGSVLIVTIVVIAVAIILSWGLPYIESTKLESSKKTAFSELNIREEAVVNMVREGYENNVIVNRIQTRDSYISLNSSVQRMIVYYSTNNSYNFTVSGLEDEGSFVIHMLDYEGTKSLNNVTIEYLSDDPFMSEPSKNPLYLDLTGEPSPGIDGLEYDGDDFTVTPTDNCSDFFIKGTVFIELQSIDGLFGRILVFDIGNIEQCSESSVGNHYYFVENGCIISSDGNNDTLMREPLFYTKDNIVSFRVIQNRAISNAAAGGSFVFTIKTKLLYTGVYDILEEIYSLNISYYGDHSDVILDYIVRNHDFIRVDDNNVAHSLNDVQGEKMLITIVQSICETDVY